MKIVVIFTLLLCLQPIISTDQNNETRKNGSSNAKHKDGIHIFKLDYESVAVPFIVCVWVLIASLAKIVFHHYQWLSSTIPESCLLILLGIPIGFIIGDAGGAGRVHLTSDLFFFFLLPPIILDAGYFMTSDVFYQNIGTILLYAILGTIFNAFVVGASIFGISGVCNLEISLLKSLVFGSLISAVDPVAVLAVFEEVQVNEILYMLVFGESVLNDAASVVLYRTFESLSPKNINAEQIGLAIASFFIVSVGGTLIGVIFAIVASFITKFTDHVLVIEPVFVFLMSYLAYLVAEIFHFSGIMSILFCGLVMKPYVESNVSRKSHTTIKYFLKLLSSSCEAIIFMFLGLSLVQFKHVFNFSFIMFTLLFTTIFRAMGIVLLTGFANRFGRLSKVKKVEQFIMSYGGLRGAVAFCLAMLLENPEHCKENDVNPSEECKLRSVLVTTTISVVIFTVFVQGCTIKKLVDVLGVKKSNKREKSMTEALNDRVLSYVVAGVEEILGVHSHGFWMNLIELFSRKYLRRWLERDPELALDEELVTTQRRIAFKTALSYADKPQEIAEREQDGIKLEELKNNASAAMQLAMRAQQTPGYDGGFIDVGVLSCTPHTGTDMYGTDNASAHYCEAFNPRIISSLIPKPKPSLKRRIHNPSTRKYTLDSLEESEIHSHERHLKKQRSFQMEQYKRQSRKSPHRHRKQKNGKHSDETKFESSEISASEQTDSLLPKVGQDNTKSEEPIAGDDEVFRTEDDDATIKKHHGHHHKSPSSHHKHHHHHHNKHKHKTRRKESEVLPQVNNDLEPVRDVKNTYHYNDQKSEEYHDKDISNGNHDFKHTCIDILEEPHTVNSVNGVNGVNDVNGDDVGEQSGCSFNENDYVPDLPLYDESPSRQFSPYADTPLLDRSNFQMSGRDKAVLLEAKKKHSNVESTMSNAPHLAPQDSIIETPFDTLTDQEVGIVDPWGSPPKIIVDHHMDDQVKSLV